MRLLTAPVAWRQATIVLVIFTLAQIADGILTYWGVTTLGIHVEGNNLLATAMHMFGPMQALISAKLLACFCGYILYRTASHKPLAVMAGLYIGVAIILAAVFLQPLVGRPREVAVSTGA